MSMLLPGQSSGAAAVKAASCHSVLDMCTYCGSSLQNQTFAQCMCLRGAPLPRLQGFHHMFRMRLTTSGVMRGSIALCSIKLGLLQDNLPFCTYRNLILLLHLGVSRPMAGQRWLKQAD